MLLVAIIAVLASGCTTIRVAMFVPLSAISVGWKNNRQTRQGSNRYLLQLLKDDLGGTQRAATFSRGSMTLGLCPLL